MKKGYRKCSYCQKVGKHKYKKGRLNFCTPGHKQKYFENHLPTLIKETQTEFNALITERKVCAKCGNSYDKMHCSHIKSVGAHPNLRFDILNVLPMDGRCHQFDWHDNPTEATLWFQKKYPERWAYLEFAKNQIKPWGVDEVKKIRKAVKERDLHALVRFREEFKNST